MISIIVPVYKVEAYLDRCIKSILNQTHQDFELILVDDGSPDNCPAVCDMWAQKDARIKVVHKKNGGLSDARNVGLDTATGEYIAFVDSDDYIHPQMYELMLDAAQSANSEMVVCRFQEVDGNTTVECPTRSAAVETITVDSRIALEQYYEKYLNLIWMSACIKLYHRSIFNTLRFRKGVIFEDLDLFPHIIAETKNITIIEEKLYYYTTDSQSITRSPFSEKYFDTIEMRGRHMEFFIQRGIWSQAQKSASLYIDSLIQTYQAINKKNKCLQQKFWEYIEKYYRPRKSQIIKYGQLSRMRRIVLNIFPYCPRLAVKIYEYISR